MLLTGGHRGRSRATGFMSIVPATASSRSPRAAGSSAATTRLISSLTANICRCGRSSPYIGLSRLAPGDLDFTPGPGPRTIDVGGEWGKVGFDLCYEIIFSGHVVDERNRPDFIFNPSNDAWFGSWGPPQHLAQARLRAAEEGLPVLRATPTGISAVIDGRGNVVKELPWHSAGVIDAVLPPAANSPTPFARLGNAIPLLLAVLLIAGGIVLGRTRR